MSKRETPLPSRANALRARIYHLEQKHATAYPHERKKLAMEIREAIAEYHELLPKIETEAERLKEELRREWSEVHRKRGDLLRLLGQVPEPQPSNAMGTPLGREPAFEKAFKYPMASLCHYGEPSFSQPRLVSKQEAEAYRQMDDPEYWRNTDA